MGAVSELSSKLHMIFAGKNHEQTKNTSLKTFFGQLLALLRCSNTKFQVPQLKKVIPRLSSRTKRGTLSCVLKITLPARMMMVFNILQTASHFRPRKFCSACSSVFDFVVISVLVGLALQPKIAQCSEKGVLKKHKRRRRRSRRCCCWCCLLLLCWQRSYSSSTSDVALEAIARLRFSRAWASRLSWLL